MRFQLLVGTHVGDDNKHYTAGDIIETQTNLAARFNEPNCPPKFRRLTEKEFAAEQENQAFRKQQEADKNKKPGDGLDSLSLEDLRKLAEEEEIDLGKSKTKEEVLKAIRSSGARV